MNIRDELERLYNINSRHSQYQILTSNFDPYIKSKVQPKAYKYEKERMAYIDECLDMSSYKRGIDIGGNTGYFSFEFLNRAKNSEIDLYEGNKEHCEFVDKSAKLLNVSNRLHVINKYFDFLRRTDKIYDICFLLNVIHHFGYDFGNSDASMEEAKDGMIKSVNALSKCVRIIVLQIGFNWGGDISRCLFSRGTKEEMIQWLVNGVRGNWKIERIGVGVGTKLEAEYKELDDENIQREDALGEFLNRPLFIMKSKQFS